MAISGADEILTKISSQIDSQFPGFIREEGPQFVAFMKAYFEYMEQSGNAIAATRSLRDAKDIDRTVDGFLEYFRKEFMVSIPSSALADKRLLVKHIREFYRTRGSQESYRFLFRALYNQEIEFYYPGDDILRASDGRWVQETKLRVGEPYNVDPESLGGRNVRGVVSGAKAIVQRVSATISSGIVLYDMVVQNVSGTFVDGERVVDDYENYVTVNAQIGSLIDINIVDGGAFHNIGDQIEITGSGSTQSARAIVTSTKNTGGGVTLKLVKGGSGYTRNAKLNITGGNGTGFEAKIASFSKEPIATILGIDTIAPFKNVPINAGPYFVAKGANTSSVRLKLTGTVKLSTGSNTIYGQGTNFVNQLAVGDIVRVKGSANTLRVHSITGAQTFVSAIRPTTNITVGANAYTALAAANAYSVLRNALSYSANNFYLINAVAIINPGYGYTTLPTVTITDDDTAPLNIFDGTAGYLGRNVVVVSNSAPGSIETLRIYDPGQNFNKYGYAALLNSTQGNTVTVTSTVSANVTGGVATRYTITKKTFSGSAIPIPSGIVKYPGRYIDTKGFLSWNNKLQDNYYYQEFSYVVRVAQALEKYREIIKSLVHPVGTKLFGHYIISSAANTNTLIASTRINIFTDSVTGAITLRDSVVGGLKIAAAITEPTTVTDTTDAYIYRYGSITESVTATDSVIGKTTAVGVISAETVTADDTVQVRFDAKPIILETITLADSTVGITKAVAAVSESVTSTDSVVGATVFGNVAVTTESITSTDSITPAVNYANISTATESVSATDSISSVLLIGGSISETITTTDTLVGTSPFNVTITESSGLITPYASTLISVYQSTQINDFVGPVLNLDDTVNRA
jgi:hypothetical protein